MSHRRLVIGVSSAVCTLLLASAADAQASRTWVSGVGDDANPCSRTAPCKTFAGAISKTAAGGEINALDPGGYGAVTITKAITIDGGSAFASILASGTNGVIVNAATNDVVTLRNLSINGIGTGLNGVRFLAGGALHLESVTIFGFAQLGVDVQPATGARIFVRDCEFRENNNPTNGGGMAVKATGGATARVSIDRTRFDRNTVGLRVEDGARVTVSNSTASGNTNGFHVIGSASTAALTLENSSSTNNTAFGVLTNGGFASAVLSNTLVTGNATGITGTITSFGTNRILNNTTLDGTPSATVSQQ